MKSAPHKSSGRSISQALPEGFPRNANPPTKTKSRMSDLVFHNTWKNTHENMGHKLTTKDDGSHYWAIGN